MQGIRVVIIGPYIVHNFGDDLIGAILARYMQSEHQVQCSIPGLARANAEWLECHHSNSLLKSVVSAHSIVIGGGGILGDSGNSPEIKYIRRGIRAATIAKFLNKKVVLTAVGAGPLCLRKSRVLCRALCSFVQAIGVRDQESRKFLTEVIKVSPEKITLGADVALLWTELLPITPIKNGLFGVQCDVLQVASEVGEDRVDYLHTTLSNWCNSNQGRVTLVSNGKADTALARRMKNLLPSLRYNELSEFLPQLAGLRCIITTHLHLAIAAYAAGIPCFSIFVREKTARFYRQIGHPERALDLKTATNEEITQLIRDAESAEWTPEDEAKRLSLCKDARSLLKVTDQVASSNNVIK